MSPWTRCLPPLTRSRSLSSPSRGWSTWHWTMSTTSPRTGRKTSLWGRCQRVSCLSVSLSMYIDCLFKYCLTAYLWYLICWFYLQRLFLPHPHLVSVPFFLRLLNSSPSLSKYFANLHWQNSGVSWHNSLLFSTCRTHSRAYLTLELELWALCLVRWPYLSRFCWASHNLLLIYLSLLLCYLTYFIFSHSIIKVSESVYFF